MSRAAGSLLVLAPRLGPGDLLPCLCPRHPPRCPAETRCACSASGAPAAPQPSGVEGAAVPAEAGSGRRGPPWPPGPPVAAASRPSPGGPGLRALLPWGGAGGEDGGGQKEDRNQFAWRWARTLSFLPRVQTALHRAGARAAVPVPAVCPVCSALASSPDTCPCHKKRLSQCQRP